jgi:hypothetical protein
LDSAESHFVNFLLKHSGKENSENDTFEGFLETFEKIDYEAKPKASGASP